MLFFKFILAVFLFYIYSSSIKLITFINEEFNENYKRKHLKFYYTFIVDNRNKIICFGTILFIFLVAATFTFDIFLKHQGQEDNANQVLYKFKESNNIPE